MFAVASHSSLLVSSFLSFANVHGTNPFVMKPFAVHSFLLFGRHVRTMSSRQYASVIDKAFINGQWVSAASGKTFQVVDPATCQPISSVPDMNIDDVKLAVASADKAFQSWKHTTAKERSQLLRKWYELLVEHQQSLAEILTLEAGKPLSESLGEVGYGNAFVEWFAEEAKRTYGEVVPSPVKSRELIVLRQPIGPVGLITPWNFPHAMITRKAAAAIAAGCTCVIKPAEDTPFTALALAELAAKAGLPKGVINVVTSSRANAGPIGKYLCESPQIAGISFTGSTAVGKLLYEQCAEGVKRLGLELGGNAPFIVFAGANLEKAADGALASKFRNCGQTCISANRFLIQDTVFDEFVAKLRQRIEKLVMGDGKTAGCTMGPLINMDQVKKVEQIVEDAVAKGAKVVVGGKRALELGERFFHPTLLTGIKENMRCYKEEIFGPVAVCIPFSSEEECVKVANSTERGLAGYFYTGDIAQAWRVAKELEVGMVGVNEGLISHAETPFGGIKESGIGREGSKHGMDEYTYIKYVCFGNL